MDRRRRKQARVSHQQMSYSEEVSSTEWEFINMTDQEEDLINRMYKLVGPRWDIIAGRIPERKAEEIERFWIMKHGDAFASRRSEVHSWRQRYYDQLHNGCTTSSNHDINLSDD